MSNRTLGLSDALYDYLLSVSLREPEILVELRRETMAMSERSMQIAPEQGQFMALLVRLTGARRILEIGTFTGYSALAMALALPPEGRIVACDVSEAWTAVARRYWRRAGVAERIELRLAPAVETLDALVAQGGGGSFDFAFIDADKGRYLDYYERSLTLLRPGGLIAVDNTLWGGGVADLAKTDADTAAIRAFNAALHDDPRVELSLVPIGDGLTLARKR
ncbi:MAG: class I SAM-dependent methyltransferase [Rhodospirillales bacterium]|jgi:predicted O-methyltransferase YrrM|nr:class I SAM-dependent methyltransferase [Rhodospirillales bacterium]